jgi:hypothetical protein
VHSIGSGKLPESITSKKASGRHFNLSDTGEVMTYDNENSDHDLEANFADSEETPMLLEKFQQHHTYESAAHYLSRSAAQYIVPATVSNSHDKQKYT